MSNESTCRCGGELHGACKTEFQYAVKLVCGVAAVLPNQAPPPVAPGLYKTAINIHNPSKCKVAHIRWKVSVAAEGRPGTISQYRLIDALKPDESIEIDCPDVMRALPPPPPSFVKGYVVAESDEELDVVAVYTSAQSATAPVNTFHTERVQGRCVPVCDDLILPLDTGRADWQAFFPQPTPVALVNPLAAGWISPPGGSSWVSQLSTHGMVGNTGGYLYVLQFELCFGFTMPPQFQIQGSADGSAQVFVNAIGQSIGTLASWGGYSTLTFNTSFLRPGTNYLIVAVNNGGGTPNPTGFALTGVLVVPRGKCPCSQVPLRGRGAAIPAEFARSLDLPSDFVPAST